MRLLTHTAFGLFLVRFSTTFSTFHLLIDSFTVTGVYWLYPIGKYHLKGPFSMSRAESKSIEKYLQTAFFTSSGLLFFARQILLPGVFSYEGIILIGALLIAGYYLFKAFGKVLERIIRGLGLL